MITYLPSPDFNICAAIIDVNRIGPQLQQCWWIAKRLAKDIKNETISSKGNSAVYTLWTDIFGIVQLPSLRQYQIALHDVWLTIHHTPHQAFLQCRHLDKLPIEGTLVWPNAVHESHRAALYQKDPSFYAARFRMHGLSVPTEFNGYTYANPILVRPSGTGEGVS